MPEGFFEISRGIKQGDPLSPSLYIIMVDAFGRAVANAYNKKRFQVLLLLRICPTLCIKNM